MSIVKIKRITINMIVYNNYLSTIMRNNSEKKIAVKVVLKLVATK